MQPMALGPACSYQGLVQTTTVKVTPIVPIYWRFFLPHHQNTYSFCAELAATLNTLRRFGGGKISLCSQLVGSVRMKNSAATIG